MLVLTRKSNQSIMIGDDIEVSVLSIMGEKVRIGIQAPRDIPVFRKGVFLEVQEGRRGGGGPPRRWRWGGRGLRAQGHFQARKAGGGFQVGAGKPPRGAVQGGRRTR